MAMEPKAVIDAKKSRPQRTPLGQRNRLSFDNLDPNFQYRIINDRDDRLKRAQQAGYEFVESDEIIGDIRVAEGTSIDSRVAKPVGNGITGYLMRIPKEFYDEDQAGKIAEIEKTEAAMTPVDKEGKGTGVYGEGLTKT